jgi:hypothetical protein
MNYTQGPKQITIIDDKINEARHNYDMSKDGPGSLTTIGKNAQNLLYCGFDFNRYLTITPWLTNNTVPEIENVVSLVMQPRQVIISNKDDEKKELREIVSQRRTISDVVDRMISDASRVANSRGYQYFGVDAVSEKEYGAVVVPGGVPYSLDMASEFLRSLKVVGRMFNRFENESRYKSNSVNTQTWVITPTVLLYTMKQYKPAEQVAQTRGQ